MAHVDKVVHAGRAALVMTTYHFSKGDPARGHTTGGENDEYQATGLGQWEYVVDEDGELVPNENLYRAERRDLGDDIGRRDAYGGNSPD